MLLFRISVIHVVAIFFCCCQVRSISLVHYFKKLNLAACSSAAVYLTKLHEVLGSIPGSRKFGFSNHKLREMTQRLRVLDAPL